MDPWSKVYYSRHIREASIPFGVPSCHHWDRRFRTIICAYYSYIGSRTPQTQETKGLSDLKSWHSGPKLQALRATSCNRDDKHQVDDRQHAPNNLMTYYMIKLIQSLPSPLPKAGNYSHMRKEVM